MLWNIAAVSLYVGNKAPHQDQLYFSLQGFPTGEGTTTIALQPVLVSEFQLPPSFPTIIEKADWNEYEKVLTEANKMGEGFDEHIIILFSDGTFSEGQEKEEQDKTADAISELFHKAGRTKLFLVVCNHKGLSDSDRGWWEKRVTRIYDLNEKVEWLPSLVEEQIGWSLSNQNIGGWFTHTREIALPPIPGDAEKVEINMVVISPFAPFQGQPQYRLGPNGGDYNFMKQTTSSLNIYSTGGISLSPIGYCDHHSNKIILPSENTGLYTIEIERPRPSMIIAPGISVNNEPVTIQVQLLDIPSPAWSSCYRTNLKIAGGIIEQQEIDKSSLSANYIWRPFDVNCPRTITGTIELKTTKGEVIKAMDFRLEVKFRPRITKVGSTLHPSGSWHQDQFMYEFPVQYLPNSFPRVFLCTPKNPDEIRGVNSDEDAQIARGKDQSDHDLTCPVPEDQVFSSHCYPVPANAERLSAQHPAVIYQRESKFALKIYRFLFLPEQCGYRTVIFDWPEASDTIPTTWRCSLSDGSCEED